ncbi:MAG TPA: sigma-70 family RNA polymerase sigma factor [Actinomycetota bacterium]
MRIITGPGKEAIGVRAGFEPFFRTHFDGVARAAALVAGDAGAGQEVAQEAFLRLFQRWGLMESDDHARNFAYKVGVNLARSHVRKHRPVIRAGLRHADGLVAPAGPAADGPDVLAALATLSQRQRACVVLVDLADMDSATAASVLGISASTVRVQVMRGRQALRRALALPEGERDEG